MTLRDPRSARRPLRARLVLTTALAGLVLPVAAAGQTVAGVLPNGGDATVVAGRATITGGTVVGPPPSTGSLEVTVNQNDTVINWRHFDVPSGTTANFTSGTGGPVAVLNRVTGIVGVKMASDLSGAINGTNVEVWLSNTAGILIGNGAAINTGGLVLTTLDINAASFGTGTSIRLTDSSSGSITTGNRAFSIVTNNGVLAMIAPVVRMDAASTPTLNAGTGNAVFATASDVTMSNPGSPLAITLNAGTAVAGTSLTPQQQVTGTVTAGRAYFLLTAQTVTNALLNINAGVTTATAAGGVVVLAGDGLSQGTAGIALASTGPGSAAPVPVAVTLDGAIGAGGAGSSLYVGVRKGTLASTNANRLTATGDLTISTGPANADIGLDNKAVDGGSVSLNAGTGAVKVASVTSAGNYTLSGASFSNGALAPTLNAGTASLFTINATGGGTYTLRAGFTAPGSLTVNAINGGQLILAGNVTATGGALGLLGEGGIALGADAVLSGGTGITVNSTVTGAHSLTLNTGGTTGLAAVNGVTALTTDAGGTTTLNGNVTTTGSQTYNDAVVLGADVTVNAGAGDVTFADALTGAHALAVNSTGTTTFNAVGQGAAGNALASLTTNVGGTTLLKGNVATTGGQAYNDGVTLGATATVQAGGGGIAFNGTLRGAFGLTATTSGTTTFGDVVGGAGSALTSILVNGTGGTAINTAAITTAGAQGYTATTLGGAAGITTLTSSGNGAIGFTGAVNAATTAVSRGLSVVTTGRTTFGGAVGDRVELASLATSATGTVSLDGGAVSTTGNQGYGAATLGADTVLTGSAAGAAFAATSVNGNGKSLTLDFGGAKPVAGSTVTNVVDLNTKGAGTTTLSGTITTTGTQTYDDAVTLGGNVVLSAGVKAVSLNGTVDATTAGTETLTVNATGTTTFGGTVGGTTRLGALTTDAGAGGTTITAAVTADSQTYNDAVTVTGGRTLTAATAMQFKAGLGGTGDVTLAGAGTKSFAAATTVSPGSLTTSGGALTISNSGVTTTRGQTYNSNVTLGAATVLIGTVSTITGTFTGGGNDLTLNFSGASTVDGALIGGVRNLETGNGGTTTLTGTITTTGTQRYRDAIAVGGANTIVAAGASAISFDGAIDAVAANTQALTVNTTGATTFGGTIGGTRALNALTTSASGTTTINAAAVTTSGAQTYNDAVTLGADVTFTGSSVSFAGGLNGNDGVRDHDLTLTTTGDDTIGAAVTGVRALSVGGGGTIFLSGAITTSGSQTYRDAVTLNGATTLSTGTGTANAILFSGTVDGGQTLSLMTAGTTTFTGAVGGMVALTSLETDAGGTTAINGGGVTTTGTQTYRDAVKLGGTGVTTLTSTGNLAIALNGTVDAAASGVQGLATSSSGGTTFGGVVGGTAPLASLSVTGPTQLNTTAVTTTGDQGYSGLVTLGADAVLTGATPTFGAGFAGNAHDLALAFSGTTAITGAFTGIRNLSTSSLGATTLTGVIATSGTQTYGNAVTLLGATTTRSTASGVGGNADVTFSRTIDGRTSLAVQTPGTGTFNGMVGGGTVLTQLTTDAGGATTINADITADTQSYADAVTVTGARTLTAATAMTFNAGLGSANALTLAGNGARTFGAAGGVVSLGALASNSGGALAVNGGGVTTTGTQTYADTVTVGSAVTAFNAGAAAITFAAINAATADAHGLTATTTGTVRFNGAVGATRLASLTVNGAGGLTEINTGTITTYNGQSYNTTSLLADTTLTSGNAGTIVFKAALDGGNALTVNTGGTTRFSGTVGAGTALSSLTTDAGGTTEINAGSVRTVNGQSYADQLVLGADTTLAGTTASFFGVTGNGHDLTLNLSQASTLNGPAIAGLRNLVTDAGGGTFLSGALTTSGTQTYNDQVTLTGATTLTATTGAFNAGLVGQGNDLTLNFSGVTALDSTVTGVRNLATDAAGTTILTGTLTTSGSQTYNDRVTLTSGGGSDLVSLTAGNAADIRFANLVDATAAGVQRLSVATAGTTTFAGAVGGGVPLAALATDAAGTTAINASVTAAAQTYADAVTIGAGTQTLTAAGGLTFGKAVNGPGALVLAGAGARSFGDTVGAGTALASLAISGGATTLSGNVTTAGFQSYGSGVVLARTVTATAGGDVAFAGPLDAATAGGQGLSVATTGVTTFGGVVGATALAGLATDAGGSTRLNGGSVTTTGAQSYGDAVTLGAATVLTAGGTAGIGFATTLDGAQTLRVATAGPTTFGGAVGNAAPLAALATDAGGTTAINGGRVVTTGGQRYGDAVLLGADATVASTGAGAITFDAAIDGGRRLLVNTAGVTTFSGAVGGTTPLTALVTDAPGTTVLAGGSVTAAGQSYGDPVTLAADARLTGATLLFGGAVDGNRILSLTGGSAQFGGAIGSTAALAGLALRLASFAAQPGNRVGVIAASVGGGLAYDDAAALTVGTVDGLSGIATGGAATTLSAAGPLTLAANVASGDASFTGLGIVQAAGTSVNAGAGTIQLNARDGALALAGTLATANATGNAVRLVNAANATLGTILTGAAGTVTLGLAGGDNLSGAVTQTAGATIATGTLVGAIGGPATLTNAGNSFATLGALSANGLALRDSGAGLTVAGPVDAGTGNLALTLDAGTLALAGNLTAATGVVTLTGGGAISQGAGAIVADTLTGSAAGGAALTAAGNAVNTLAGFRNVNSGGFAFVDGRALRVTGDVIASGDLTMTAPAIDFTGVTLAGTGSTTLAATGGAVVGAVATGGINLTIAGAGLDLGVARADGGALALSATGAGGTLAVRTISAGGAATLSAVGPATVAQARAGTTLTIAANGIAAGALTAGGAMALTSGGALVLTGDATAGAEATLKAASIDFTGRTVSAGGAATLTAGGDVVGGTVTGGSGLTVSGAGLTLGTARAIGGPLALTATGADRALSVGTAGAGGAATLSSQGALAVTAALTTGTAATLTAAGSATLGQSGIGTAFAVAANGIAAGATTAGTTMTLTSGGGITLASARSGGDAVLDANGTATLGAVTAGTSAAITVRALDAAITGAQTAARVAFVNRNPAAPLRIGNGTGSDGFRLSQDEVNLVNAGALVVNAGAGNVEMGAMAFNGAAGAASIAVLTTGRIDVTGAVSSSGSGRSVQLGGTAASTDDKASVIEVAATAAGGGGRLLFDGAALDLRGGRIGVGQSGGFLAPIGFDGASGQSAGAVSSAYVANANSALYNATYGGAAYQPTGVTLLQARSLTVRYTDYALFQNTGAPGVNAGVALGGTTGAPVASALVIQSAGTNNAFALFGTINGISGTGTALLGQQVIAFSGVNLVNTRVNGCVVGSGAGCLTSTVSQPVLNVFDSSRLNVFRSADDLALPFDPVVGGNNEALFSGVDVLDVSITGTDCAGSDDPGCRQDAPPQGGARPAARQSDAGPSPAAQTGDGRAAR